MVELVPASVSRWKALTEKYAVTPLLPAEVLAIIWTESWGNPKAINPSDPSYGLMQLTMSIARFYGKDIVTPDQLYDPDVNVSIGAAFLLDLKNKYSKNHSNWVTAFNQGEGNLLKGLPDTAYETSFTGHLLAINIGLYPPPTA